MPLTQLLAVAASGTALQLAAVVRLSLERVARLSLLRAAVAPQVSTDRRSI